MRNNTHLSSVRLNMIIGVPKELKVAESRVALLPTACTELIRSGHELVVQRDAGVLSDYSNEEYRQAGCTIKDTIEEIYKDAELIVKVKEPQAEEYKLIQKRHILFCYLHLAAADELERILIESGSTAIAFEGVTDSSGGLPLLKPMSIIAGKLAAQYACILLHKHHGGRGILIDGLGAIPGAVATVLGFGSAGKAATAYLQRVGANVCVIDKIKQKLVDAEAIGENVKGLEATEYNISQAVTASDVVIGAVLVPGARAPVIVNKSLVAQMPNGSVIVDIAVDQGGCIETTKATTYEEPTYITEGVVHFAVQNIPAAVPRTASQVLSHAILPGVVKIAANQWMNDRNIVAGLSVQNGNLL